MDVQDRAGVARDHEAGERLLGDVRIVLAAAVAFAERIHDHQFGGPGCDGVFQRDGMIEVANVERIRAGLLIRQSQPPIPVGRRSGNQAEPLAPQRPRGINLQVEHAGLMIGGEPEKRCGTDERQHQLYGEAAFAGLRISPQDRRPAGRDDGTQQPR